MTHSQTDEGTHWLEVIAKSLAYLCLETAKTVPDKVGDRASFLSRFGLRDEEAALILGTSAASLRELRRQAKKRRTPRRPHAKQARKSVKRR